MRPRPMTEPRLPHSRSTGWVRFSRLGCPMSSEGWSRGLGCVSSFLWCFAYFWNMTSRTYGIFKSSCRVKLDTYQGAFVIICGVFDCAFCSITWLDLLAQPQMVKLNNFKDTECARTVRLWEYFITCLSTRPIHDKYFNIKKNTTGNVRTT